MTCEQIQEKLPAYQDGELSAENEKAIKTHLDVCEVCRKEEKLLSESWEMLGDLKSIEPSPNFEARFWARVRQEESKQTGWRSLLPAALGLAGMAAVWVIGVTGGFLLFENHNRKEVALINPSSVVTSPYPPNSIEQIFMKNQTSLKRERI
jgi:predicted anti-sigma-YlaC factor YlaD